MNDQETVPSRKLPSSVWDLPASLMTQPHRFRKRAPKRGRERLHHAAILAFIYRNRFATASQVQRRFANILKSDRTARRHLAEMQESLGYLDLVPTPSPLWPKVYSVSCRGMRKLARAFQKKQPSWKPPVSDRRRAGFSIHHVYHELACTEFLLQVYEAAKATGVELLESQRRSLVKNDAFRLPVSSGSRLVPDGMFLLQSKQGMICTFLELDTGSMALTRVAEKLQLYSTWAKTERSKTFIIDTYGKHGASNPQHRFRIVVVCGNSNQTHGDERLNSLIRIADKLPEPTGNHAAWLTTTKSLRDVENVLTGSIWSRHSKNGATSRSLYPFLAT